MKLHKRILATAAIAVGVTSFSVIDNNVEAATPAVTVQAPAPNGMGASVSVPPQQVLTGGTVAPEVRLSPEWTRNCSFWTCTVYFNKRETYLIHIGGSYVSSIACGALRYFFTFAVCASFAWLIGSWADRAYSTGKCVYVRFPRLAPVVLTGAGTYGPSWRCT